MVLSAREFLNILDSFTLYGSILGFNMVIFVFFVHGNIAIKGMCQVSWHGRSKNLLLITAVCMASGTSNNGIEVKHGPGSGWTWFNEQ